MSSIRVDFHVSGSHGDFYTPQEDSDNHHRKKSLVRIHLFGQAIYSVGPNKYKVLWYGIIYKVYYPDTMEYEGEGVPFLEHPDLIQTARVFP